jgi:hypothetical protein
MPKKKFVLRINEETLKAVERWAQAEFRSVNGQLEWMINKSLRDTGRHPKSLSNTENKSEEDTNE